MGKIKCWSEIIDAPKWGTFWREKRAPTKGNLKAKIFNLLGIGIYIPLHCDYCCKMAFSMPISCTLSWTRKYIIMWNQAADILPARKDSHLPSHSASRVEAARRVEPYKARKCDRVYTRKKKGEFKPRGWSQWRHNAGNSTTSASAGGGGVQ